MKTYNIILAGVGGQGVLTLAGIIARAAFLEGYDVKASELHGLSMRFGSIDVNLRIGKNIYSPLVPLRSADLIISQEPLEAARKIKYANKNTVFILDTKPQIPIISYIEKTKYPSISEIKTMLSKSSKKIITVDASEVSIKEAGSSVMANIFLLGRLAAEKVLPIKKESYIKIMKEILKPAALEQNLKIFELGYKSKQS